MLLVERLQYHMFGASKSVYFTRNGRRILTLIPAVKVEDRKQDSTAASIFATVVLQDCWIVTLTG